MTPAPRYAFGDVELDTGRVLLLRDRAPLAIEPKAFAVLLLLVERAPQVVDKAEIFAAVWKDTAVTDNALTRIVTQLRRVLGDDAKDPRYIATVATRGYRLMPDVQRIEGNGHAAIAAGTAEPSAPDSPPASPGSASRAAVPSAARHRTGPSPRPVAMGLGIAALAVVAVLGAWLASGRRTVVPRAAHAIGDLDLTTAASLRLEQMTASRGFDGYVAFSPDGASIAYGSDRAGPLEVYVEGLADGSTPASLTRDLGQQAIQPAWSPDGRLIAYHDMAGDGLWVVPSRGGAARKVADVGAHPSWSPDGRRLAYQSRSPADLNAGGSFGADSTIWIVDVDGRTAPRALTRPGQPVGSHEMPHWWPGASRVVFAVIAPAGAFLGAALWTVDADTAAVRPLSADQRLSPEFAVAPDGRGVLFAARSSNVLWWLPVDDGTTAGLPKPTGIPTTGSLLASLAISPDGRRLAWTSNTSSSGIWSAAVGARAATAPTPVVPAADIGWRAGHPTVAPDGRLAFMGNRGNAGNKIFLVDGGDPPRQLTTDARDHFSPFWLAGEDALAVLSDHGDGLGWWRLDPRTGREQPLFRLSAVVRPAGVQSQVMGPSAGMAISADLRRLAVAYVRDGVPNLWTAPLGPRGPSGPLVQRTFEPKNGSFGSWAPDGRWLAYQCARGGDTQICVVDGDGAQPARQLTTAAGTNFIGEWMDDDGILVAGKDRAIWNVRSVSATTGRVVALSAFVEPRFYVRYPRWDPARRRVVFERYETAGRLWSVQLPALTAAESPSSGPGH